MGDTVTWKRLSHPAAEAMARRFDRCCSALLADFRTRELEMAERQWSKLYGRLPCPDAELFLATLEDAVINRTTFKGA